VKVTPLTVLLASQKINPNLPTRDPKMLDKVLRWNDREINRYWRRTINPERY
jgi:hypothetical protein